VQAVAAADLPFVQAVLQGRPLAQALAAAEDANTSFNFEAWLIAALQAGWLAGATQEPPNPGVRP
jgi:hypothetical protein